MFLKIQTIVTILLFLVIASSCNLFQSADKCYNKGNDLCKLGKYEEAIKCFDKAIEIDPKYVGAWYNKGFFLTRMEKIEEAIKCYDKAIEIDPNFADAKTKKEEILKALGK